MPEIEYTYPISGDSNIETNRFLLVSFNKDIDESSISNDTFIISETSDPLVVISILETSLHNNRIILIKTSIEFSPDTEYTVSQVLDVFDTDGIPIPSGFSWSFSTGTSSDTTPPSVVSVTPADGSLCKTGSIYVRARFSEKMFPDDRALQECFTLKKLDDTPVPGIAEFEIEYDRNDSGEFEYIVKFTPLHSFRYEEGTEYIASIEESASGLIVTDLAGNEVVPLTWHFSTGLGAEDLEDAQNIGDGDATFGSTGTGLGLPLYTDDGQLVSGLYSVDDSLQGIFDPYAYGNMLPGRYIRIVDRGRNLMTSLGLTPIMKSLTGHNLSPQMNECYIDPSNGIFILLRPSYWSRFEDEASIISSDIYEVIPHYEDPLTELEFTDIERKWGKCLKIWGTGANYFYLWPFNKGAVVPEGTFSGWYRPQANLLVDFFLVVCFAGQDNRVEIHQDNVMLYLNSLKLKENPLPIKISKTWAHVYVVWKSSPGDRRVLVFVNGNRILSESIPPPLETGELKIYTESHSGVYNGITYIDNWKVWKEIVSEDPRWEYNGGVGRERALHVIYGPDSEEEYDYRPKLEGDDSGVGYYYLP